MSKKDETVEEKSTEFDVMPGADAVEDDDTAPLDLSFSEVEAEAEAETEAKEEEDAEETEEVVSEESEEVVAEEEAPEEPETEEAVAENEEGVPEASEEPAAEEKTRKSPMVPKSRLDEVLAKQKALQKQLDEVKAANEKPEEAPEEYNYDEKEVEYQNALLDGEVDKAAALRREIRQAERAQLEFEMRQEMSQTVAQDRQMTALQQAAAAMEEAYPVFNANSENFNQEYTNEVVELRDAFIMKGYDTVDALAKAVNYVVKDRSLDQSAEEDQPALAGKGKSVDEVAKKRKEVSRKLKAAEAQPPELPTESVNGPGEKGIDISKLTEDEFDALPEATLRRLRGDII